VKKLQNYSELVLGPGGERSRKERGSFPLRGSSMQISQASNLPMLSKTYLTANLIDINQLEGPDSFQKAKKSSIQDIIYQRQPSNIPLK